jgi:hypothetical protein
MTPEERRQAVKAALDDDPSLSQRVIAKALGVSQKTVNRDMAALGITRDSRDSPPVKHISPEGISALLSCYVTRGDSLVARLRAEMEEFGLIPTSGEEEALITAKGLADRIENLERMVARDGESRKAGGRIVLHPGIAEIRQLSAVLTRVVASIATTTAAPAGNAQKRRAADARWNKHRMKAAALGKAT